MYLIWPRILRSKEGVVVCYTSFRISSAVHRGKVPGAWIDSNVRWYCKIFVRLEFSNLGEPFLWWLIINRCHSCSILVLGHLDDVYVCNSLRTYNIWGNWKCKLLDCCSIAQAILLMLIFRLYDTALTCSGKELCGLFNLVRCSDAPVKLVGILLCLEILRCAICLSLTFHFWASLKSSKLETGIDHLQRIHLCWV